MRYVSLRKHLMDNGKTVEVTTCYTHDKCVQFPDFDKEGAADIMRDKTILFAGDSTMHQQHRYLESILNVLTQSHPSQQQAGGSCNFDDSIYSPGQYQSNVVSCNSDWNGEVATADLGYKPITTAFSPDSPMLFSFMQHAKQCTDENIWGELPFNSQDTNSEKDQALWPRKPSISNDYFMSLTEADKHQKGAQCKYEASVFFVFFCLLRSVCRC